MDILSAGSGPFDTGAAVLANFYLGIDPGLLPDVVHPFTHYSFDISALVGSGGIFDLRFAQTNNQGHLNFGVDNVSIVATPSAVAEPAALGLLALGLALLGMRRRSCVPRENLSLRL